MHTFINKARALRKVDILINVLIGLTLIPYTARDKYIDRLVPFQIVHAQPLKFIINNHAGQKCFYTYTIKQNTEHPLFLTRAYNKLKANKEVKSYIHVIENTLY